MFDGKITVTPEIDDIVAEAVRAVPPAWTLDATVAVNPFLERATDTLFVASERLLRATGETLVLSGDWYHALIREGRISDMDIQEAIAFAPLPYRCMGLDELKSLLASPISLSSQIQTIVDLATEATGTDWVDTVDERIGAWASDYFDKGFGSWGKARRQEPLAAWRAFAGQDRTPEILGLRGFRAGVRDLPASVRDSIVALVERIGVRPAAMASYLDQMLIHLGGWAQLARQEDREQGTDDLEQSRVAQLLVVKLYWEAALCEQFRLLVWKGWQRALENHERELKPTAGHAALILAHLAFERSNQRNLARLLNRPAEPSAGDRPSLQAVFCIDVRSEVFRRALEAQSARIETFGFAGFFGLPLDHQTHDHPHSEKRLPVLLNPALKSHCPDAAQAREKAGPQAFANVSRAWQAFRRGAVSSFPFVEAIGALYGFKLLMAALGRPSGASGADRSKPALASDIDRRALATAAAGILRAMSLTRNFARTVALVGHGATTFNNPHASALQCGACGGHAGDINARLLAELLNDPDIRRLLAGQGIDIPSDTLFVAALHDTTTDEVTLFADDLETPLHDQAQLKSWFEAASVMARSERMARFSDAKNETALKKRARDWSQVRPEWGLAGCSSFIIAPRFRTRGADLGGRAFLHTYDWRSDEGFKTLEQILTAPVVVASWISLQYFASTVAPGTYGAGNKLLHNVVGGIGVFEGNTGVLRTGLPWQSVHDGKNYIHEPARLAVVVEAPRSAINQILNRHDHLRAMFDAGWLSLLRLNDEGMVCERYVSELTWVDEPYLADERLRSA